jgi:hypothetical protein
MGNKSGASLSNQKATKLENAPEDIVVSVLLLLGGRMLPEAAYVCRSWYRASHSDRLWRTLFYRKWKSSDSDAENHAPNVPVPYVSLFPISYYPFIVVGTEKRY